MPNYKKPKQNEDKPLPYKTDKFKKERNLYYNILKKEGFQDLEISVFNGKIKVIPNLFDYSLSNYRSDKAKRGNSRERANLKREQIKTFIFTFEKKIPKIDYETLWAWSECWRFNDIKVKIKEEFNENIKKNFIWNLINSKYDIKINETWEKYKISSDEEWECYLEEMEKEE